MGLGFRDFLVMWSFTGRAMREWQSRAALLRGVEGGPPRFCGDKSPLMLGAKFDLDGANMRHRDSLSP